MSADRSGYRAPLTWTLAAAIAVALAGCGGKTAPKESEYNKNFACKDRQVAYIATNVFAGPQVGVVVDCAERGPRIKRWVVIDENGGKKTGDKSLTAIEFDELWEKIESTGWRNLSDCENPNAAEGDPAYRYRISDAEQTVNLACAGNELPFPFNRMTNELDLIVAKYGL